MLRRAAQRLPPMVSYTESIEGEVARPLVVDVGPWNDGQKRAAGVILAK